MGISIASMVGVNDSVTDLLNACRRSQLPMLFISKRLSKWCFVLLFVLSCFRPCLGELLAENDTGLWGERSGICCFEFCKKGFSPCIVPLIRFL